MPAVPKKKHSRNRKGGRDAHSALTKRTLTRCPDCQRALPPHRACPDCGTYRGHQLAGVGTTDSSEA